MPFGWLERQQNNTAVRRNGRRGKKERKIPISIEYEASPMTTTGGSNGR